MTMDREMALGLLALVFGMVVLTGLFYLAIWMQNHWPWFVAGPIIAFLAYNGRWRR